MAGKIFIDTNVLIYANNTGSPYCLTARTKLQDVFIKYDSIWLSRQVFREFASVVSREMISSGNLDFDKLDGAIKQFERDFQVAEDSLAVTTLWLHLLKETNSAGKQVHDANIAATMLVYGVDSLLTHNVSDFKRFSNLITVVPLIP